jgi:hypothetical protein
MVLMIVALLAVAAFAPAAQAADPGNFDLTVKHRINGTPLARALDLPLDRNLPVDVYVNGTMEFTFEKADTVKTQLPAGEYDIEVKLAGTDVIVLSLYDAEIPAGADVEIIAKRTGAPGLDGIGLKVKIK